MRLSDSGARFDDDTGLVGPFFGQENGNPAFWQALDNCLRCCFQVSISYR
jgi:hypothetical protein